MLLLGSIPSTWTPNKLPSLFFYDDNQRSAPWDSGVSSENLSELTTMAWVRPDSVTGYRGTVIGRGASGAEHWRYDQNATVFRGIENGANFGQRGTADAGVWIHCAFRYWGAGTNNATRLRVWIDGVEQTPTYIGTMPASLTSRSGNWWVGRMTDGSNAYQFGSNGRISQAIVCGAALSPEDIQRAYHYTNARK
jgi:hypothetical protein